MPNDCDNNVHIVFNTEEECKDFVKKYIIDDKFSFNAVVPEPKTKKECPEVYICDPAKVNIVPDKAKPWFNWYKFHKDNWGTKWTAYENIININGKELSMFFCTAWYPCIEVIRSLCIQNPNAEIEYTYYECGMQYAGGNNNGIEYRIPPENQLVYRKWLIEQGYETQEYFDELDNEKARLKNIIN